MKQIIIIFALSLLILGCSQQPADTVTDGAQESVGGEVSIEVEQQPAAPESPQSIAPEPTLPAEPASGPETGTAAISTQGNEHQIIINRNSFEPEELTVSVGDTITWVSQDDRSHVVVGRASTTQYIEDENLGWKSPTMKQGESYSYTFQKKGEFSYLDSVFGFKGKIIIE